MLAGTSHNSAKAPASDQPARPDGRDRKEQGEHNPVWQSLALSSMSFQPKLTISQPDDPYEIEADRVADRVMRMSVGSSPDDQLSNAAGSIQRKCDACDEEEQLQRKEHDSATTTSPIAPSIVHAPLNSPGQPLDPVTRSFMEERFNQNFGAVRVHTGNTAETAARAVRAHAYTLGSDIVFGPGRYAPRQDDGKRLLAHELAHVVQQSGGSNRSTNLTPAPAQVSRDEVEADLEVPPPAEREDLRQRGIDLPAVASADPRQHSDYIDRRVNAVGFGIHVGGFHVFCDGMPLPILVPHSHFDFGLRAANTSDFSIHPDRDSALRAVPIGAPTADQHPVVTFYRGAGGGIIAPTIFSPATTPRVVETALRAQQALANEVIEALAVLGVSIVGGMVARALLNRVARIGRGPTTPPVAPGTGANFGREMAREMSSSGFRGNPFREFARRLNARPQRLPPQETADAIATGTREFTQGNMATGPPVQVGNVLVVPSRAPIPNAPVMGVRADGSVMMGRVERMEIVRTPAGVPVVPPEFRMVGRITWE